MVQKRILVAGYLSIDTLETAGGRYDNVPGGAALYSALGVRHAGEQAALLAAVGEDYPVDWLNGIARLGIDVSLVQRRSGPTRRAALHYADGGTRVSPNHGQALWWQRTLALAPPPPVNLVHIDALVACPMPLETLSTLLQYAHQCNLPVVADTSEAFVVEGVTQLLQLMSGLTAFAPSREETRQMWPGLCDDEAALALAARGVHVLQKRGAMGAWAVPCGGRQGTQIPAPPVVVVDATGAGDATVGALAVHLLGGTDFLLAATAALATGALAVSGIGSSAFGFPILANE
jgi:ribokinase